MSNVIQRVEPWLSEAIEKGARWGAEIARALQETHYGILCMTPENLTAPWILFEAGALSKNVEYGRVCAYLLDVSLVDLPRPLGQFQHASLAKGGQVSSV